MLVSLQARDHRRHPEGGLPVADAVLARIAALYAIEKEIRGKDPTTRQAVRAERSRPLIVELETFLRAQAARLSSGSGMARRSLIS